MKAYIHSQGSHRVLRIESEAADDRDALRKLLPMLENKPTIRFSDVTYSGGCQTVQLDFEFYVGIENS